MTLSTASASPHSSCRKAERTAVTPGTFIGPRVVEAHSERKFALPLPSSLFLSSFCLACPAAFLRDSVAHAPVMRLFETLTQREVLPGAVRDKPNLLALQLPVEILFSHFFSNSRSIMLDENVVSLSVYY